MVPVVAISTTVYELPRDQVRYELAQQFLINATTKDHNVVLVDGSPDINLRKSLMRDDVFVHPQLQSGMPASRREAFSHADQYIAREFRSSFASREIICYWSEPEKDDVPNHISQLMAPIVNDEADIVIMGRTQESDATYPEFQRVSERIADYIYQQATGIPAKPMAGPVVFRYTMMGFFMQCFPQAFGIAPNFGYIQHLAPVMAYAAGARVIGIDVDFQYPRRQKAEEESTRNLEMIGKRLEGQLEPCIHSYYAIAKFYGLPRHQ
ncbi:MAG: hypothetical protein G01um101466_149 [Parcubacteria group bacterium Gr01-1014_66]|nr:MAG: hypothetical protein G01um101466_149 [Parcubacteria group bacterium Gr01-1014_66]